jgi:hypothetical protein
LTNLAEFRMGSNPRDASSGVSISSIALSVDGTNVVLTFTAFANQTYTVEATTGFGELVDAGAGHRGRGHAPAPFKSWCR